MSNDPNRNSNDTSDSDFNPQDETEKETFMLQQELQMKLDVPTELIPNDIEAAKSLLSHVSYPEILLKFGEFYVLRSWQIKPLIDWNEGEDLKWISENYLDLLKNKDNEGRTILHYAALSKTIDPFLWCLAYDKNLLEQRDNYKRGIAHYAAISANIPLLSYLNINYPKLLDQKDKYNMTPAHIASYFAQPKSLEWLQRYRPNQIKAKDQWGRTIAHYCCYNFDKKNVEGLIQNYPALLEERDKYGFLPVNYTLAESEFKSVVSAFNQMTYISGIKNFDFKLTITNNTDILHPGCGLGMHYNPLSFAARGIQSLKQAMKDNFLVTKITYSDKKFSELKKREETRDDIDQILQYCKRNEALDIVKNEMIPIISGHYQKGNLLGDLPRDILRELFYLRCSDLNIPNKELKYQFDRLYIQLDPKERLSHQPAIVEAVLKQKINSDTKNPLKFFRPSDRFQELVKQISSNPKPTAQALRVTLQNFLDEKPQPLASFLGNHYSAIKKLITMLDIQIENNSTDKETNNNNSKP